LKTRKRVTITSLRGGIPSLKNCRHNLPTTAANCHNKLLTLHVETVRLLSKLSETKNHISVKVDMDEMDVTAAETPKEKEDAIIEAFRHFQMI